MLGAIARRIPDLDDRIRTKIKVLMGFNDNVLTRFIKVSLGTGRSQGDMRGDLVDYMGEMRASAFSLWLFELVADGSQIPVISGS